MCIVGAEGAKRQTFKTKCVWAPDCNGRKYVLGGGAKYAETHENMCTLGAECGETLKHIYMSGAEGAGTLEHMFISGAESAETVENALKVRLVNDETPQAKLVSSIDVDG